MQESGRLPGVHYSLTILEVVAKEQPISFGRLRMSCGNWEKSRLSRYLKPLLSTGWLRKNSSGDYVAGASYIGAAKLVSAQRDVADCLSGVVDNLALRCGESAAYVEWARNGGIVFRLKREMPESYHYLAVGAINPAYWEHPFALLALAYQDEAFREQLLQTHPHWERSEQQKWRDFFTKVREDGWICKQDKVWRLAAPVVCAQDGRFFGVIGISFIEPFTKNRREEYLQIVLQAAREGGRLATEFLQQN